MLADNFAKISAGLQHKVPDARLQVQPLPQVPEISLYLLEESYPQAQLTSEQVAWLMDDPPYWAFCWASGQVLARYLIDNPELVRNKRVVDFGCGSAVVAIAAKLAGARACLAVDLDPNALLVSKLNAQLNKVDINTHGDFFEILPDYLPVHKQQDDVILLIADVFYDAANLPLLDTLLGHFTHLIIADSRIKPASLIGVTPFAEFESHTVPDLAEASDFNRVRLYRSV